MTTDDPVRPSHQGGRRRTPAHGQTAKRSEKRHGGTPAAQSGNASGAAYTGDTHPAQTVDLDLGGPGPNARPYLVLACGPEDTAAVDLESGVLVRLRVEWPEGRQPDLSPFDIVSARVAEDPEQDDLAQPEAVTALGIPSASGTLRRRKTRRILKKLATPFDRHLLGFAGPSAPYWEFRGMRPSVALVVPARGPLLFRRPADESVWVRFGGHNSDHWLPVEDRRAAAALWTSRREKLSSKLLEDALGFHPRYLLVSVSKPRNGHCYKTVTAILPRP